MKKFLGLALIFFAAISVLAQERVIEKPEFDAVYRASFGKRANKPYREITTSEHYVNGSLADGFTSKSTAEFLPRVGYHSTYESNIQSQIGKKERIVVVNKFYIREGDGEWKEGSIETPPTPEPATKSVSSDIEYKFLGSERLNNQDTTIYSVAESRKSVNPKNNLETLSDITTRYWFSDTGELLKKEFSMKMQNGAFVSNIKSVTTYEIDPNIKIEAPELAAAKQ